MEIESNLIKIDVPYLNKIRIETEQRIKDIEKEIHRLAKREFNVGSAIQLGKLLFEELKYRYPEKGRTKSGQYSTNNATLEKIEDDYPIIKKIMEFRGLEKSLSTYTLALLENHDEDDCIKLGFNQSGTDTGRFSSPGGKGIDEDGYSGVNVQSIPKNTSDGMPDMRRAFIPRPGKKFVAIDYENEEMRIATNLSNETVWIDAIHNNIDFHTSTGSTIFRVEPSEVTADQRRLGKCVAKGTLIATERGWLPIEKIQIGDRVITHTGDLKKVTHVWDMGVKPGIQVISKNGHRLTCGLNHQFLSAHNDWIRAEDIILGSIFKTAIWPEYYDRTYNISEIYFDQTEIKESQKMDAVELMDLTVEGDHTYIAQGFVTHNTVNFLSMYGGGPMALAEKAKMSQMEAERTL
jgi:hypothetical protein